ncbi:hypothetical protein NDU88_002063 [Pleurodeles waltl]|uniref:Uncharacterized protein n=1 Tax=Pleurodeles waltl TaxID=8319 RepID=A0AAV7LEW8_PLEWA|nr:hypothetical protein NDU88_002063 [Pleurodeles waltl]
MLQESSQDKWLAGTHQEEDGGGAESEQEEVETLTEKTEWRVNPGSGSMIRAAQGGRLGVFIYCPGASHLSAVLSQPLLRVPPEVHFLLSGRGSPGPIYRGLRSRGPTNFVPSHLTSLPALRFPAPRCRGPEASAALLSAVGSAESGLHRRLSCSAGSVAPGRQLWLRRLGTQRGPESSPTRL